MRFIASILINVLICSYSLAESKDQCLLNALRQAADQDTVAEIRERCNHRLNPPLNEPPSVVEERINDLNNEDGRFDITAYNRNYLLPLTYRTNPNNRRSEEQYDGADFDQAEVKFQLSLQAPVIEGLLNDKAALWVAYTQQSWWQLYNKDYSAPFRETNYEPEVFLRIQHSARYWGFNQQLITLGYNHQSNGRGGELSRSWNRLFVSTTLDRKRLAITGRAWWRIPESDDDNPDIEKYLGYGDLKIAYKRKQQVYSATFRNNLRSDNKGAVQFDWTFPMGSRFKGYLQYFNGYGESLIDYDQSVERLGIGVLLTDWL